MEERGLNVRSICDVLSRGLVSPFSGHGVMHWRTIWIFHRRFDAAMSQSPVTAGDKIESYATLGRCCVLESSKPGATRLGKIFSG